MTVLNKRTRNRLSAALLGATLFVTGGLFSAPAQAAQKPTVMVFVDSDRLFVESTVGQHVRSQVKVYVEGLQTSQVQMVNELKSKGSALEAEKGQLTDSQLQQRAYEYEKLKTTLTMELKLQSRAIEMGEARALSEVQAVLKPIFASVMRAHSADVMLDTSMIVVGGVDLDVTSEVMAILNQRLKKLIVKPFTPEEMKPRSAQ
ncbi:MAG: OmpH family outer membrane protein [Parvibaculaceae bacterium]|nr:OmpH family outer membrane protein [Parvibaculaceae bacterium]